MKDDDPIPYTREEMQKVFSGDKGFKEFLEAIPKTDAANISKLATNPGILNFLVKLLPESLQQQVNHLLHDLFHTPQEAISLYNQGRFFEARSKLRRALEIYQFTPDASLGRFGEAVSFVTKRSISLMHGMLAEIESVLGNIEEAKSNYLVSMQLAEEIGDSDTVAKSHLGIGIYYAERGEFDEAFQSIQTALRETNNMESDPWNLRQKIINAMGIISSEIGDLEQSIEFTKQAVEISAQREDNDMLAVSLNNYASSLMAIADHETVLGIMSEALDLAAEQCNKRMQSLIMCNMVLFNLNTLGDGINAEHTISLLEDAMMLSKEIGSLSLQGFAHLAFGRLYRVIGELDKARDAYNESIEIYHDLGNKRDEIYSLQDMASFLRDEFNDLEGACEFYRQSIEIIEKIRGHLRRESHKISYAQHMVDPYPEIVDCLVRLGRPEDALEYVERSKSRSLLEFLDARLRDPKILKMDAESFPRIMKIITRMDEIRKGLEEISRRQERPDGGENERFQDSIDPHISRELREKFEACEREFADAYAELISLDPNKASMVAVMKMSRDQLMSGIDDETLLLNLYQTDKKLLVLTTSKKAPTECLEVPITREEAEELVWSVVTKIRQSASYDSRSHEYIREVQNPLAGLFDRIIKPLSMILSRYRRLIITPHLFWHYFPFHALYDRSAGTFLCDLIEIGYCQSASILTLCLKKNRTNRYRAAIMSRQSGDLPYAEKEADLLEAVFKPEGTVYKDRQAHLGQLANQEFDVIHMACHGAFNHELPFLSGIDIPPDEKRERTTYLMDFFRLDLNCTQVTLSACDSGLSRFSSADELIGLSRSLFYAGAASVMLSLWKVADESTCYLMQNYYWHYIKNQHSKTHALQLAMQAVKAKKEWAHPHFWAPFVVMGDWR